jgi:hypothetical protein
VNLTVPTSVEQITSEWITEGLRASGAIPADATVAVASVEPMGADSAFGGQLFRLGLGGDGVPASVIAKLPYPDAATRQVHDAFGAYRREVAFYRDVVSGEHPAPVRVPRPLIAALAEDSGDFVLVLEDLAPLEAADQLSGLSLAAAEAVVDELARFHAWGWEASLLETVGAPFPRLDSDAARTGLEMFGAVFGAAWPPLCARLGADLDRDVVSLGDRFAALIPFFVSELARPYTIVHGELRSDNLFIAPDGQPILIDFQVAGQQCGIFDVAYAISGSVPTATRRGNDEGLVRRYHAGLVAAGVSGYFYERAWEQYRIATMYALVYPVLASTRWESASPRGRRLLDEMVRRTATAIVDVDALSLLPPE